MRVRLLGGFAVEVDGAGVPDGAWRLRRARTLVKLLALAPGQRLHRERVIDLLWPGRDPLSAANSLHQILYVARRAITSTGAATDGLLELRGDMIVLHSGGPLKVDADEFARAAACALETHDTGEVRAALDRYTGELLPEDRYEEWAIARRDELGHTHRALLVAHAHGLVRPGDEDAATATLQKVLDADPLHEPAVRALMTTLAASGRVSEALARYERLRDELQQAYGTDPDPQTRDLFRELLARSVDAAGQAPAPARPSPEPRHNIPPPLTSFVGRDREFADVRKLLGRTRLLTLTGPGGVGKTRLAEEVGRQVVDAYGNGVWVADLVPVVDASVLPDAIAVAMGLQPGAGGDPVRALTGQIADMHALLVLDSCEHLVEACARLVTTLLRTCPRLMLMATSREPLHVPGEISFRVPSLEIPTVPIVGAGGVGEVSSVRLFRDRARHVRPDFTLDATALLDVATICRRLDGIPLAVELAAARVAHLLVHQIAERLGDALSVLGPGPRGLTRHATLRAALEWSHGLLADDEAVLFRRLAVFTGDFPLPAAESVCAGDPVDRASILDCLGRLVDKSLVQGETSGQEARYRLLDTVRQLARERLGAAGEDAAFARAHCDFYLGVAAEHDSERAGVLVDEQARVLDAEHDNLRAALSWALDHDPERALRLAVRLWRFWLARGHFREGQDRLERVLTRAPQPSSDRSRALMALGVFDCRRGRTDRLHELADEAVAALDPSGDPDEHLLGRLLRGFMILMTFDLDAAEEVAGAVAVEAEVRGSAPVAGAAWLRALVALCREETTAAGESLDECLDRLTAVDSQVRAFFPGLTICMPLIPVGDRLVPAFEETMLLGQRVGAPQAAGYVHSARGYAARFAGDNAAARAAVTTAADIFRGLGDRTGLAVALNHLGCVERDRGDAAAAGAHLEEALRLRRDLGDRRGANLTRCNQGLLAASTGDAGQARRIVREALADSEAIGDAPWTGGSLLALGIIGLYGASAVRPSTSSNGPSRCSRRRAISGWRHGHAW